jgi:hypothetical protein
MKHAGSEALDRIEDLLVILRGRGDLREKGRGVFYRKGKAFIHFHEDPAGLFCDVRPEDRWIRLPVNTAGEWRELMSCIGEDRPRP